MKKMKLEEIKDFLETRLEGVSVDSFASLNSILDQIPGIVTAKVPKPAVMSNDEKALFGGMAILATLFETAQPVELHVSYPWTNSMHDYEVVAKLGTNSAIIAYGLFSHIVAATA